MNKQEINIQNALMNIIMFIFSGTLLTILLICANIKEMDIIISGLIFAVIFPKNIKFYN